MKAPAGDQLGDSSYHPFPSGDGGPDRNAVYPTKQDVAGAGLPATQSSKSRCSLLSFGTTTAALFGFHLLNVVLGIGGSALVLILLLSNIAVLPPLIAFVVFAIVVELVRVVFPRRTWLAVALMAVGALVAIQLRFGWDGALWMILACVLLPVALFVTALLTYILVPVFVGTVKILAGVDVAFANFVHPKIPQTPCTGSSRLRNSMRVVAIDYMNPFQYKGDDPFQQIAPLGFLSRNTWAVVFYLILVKLVVGILSAIAVLLSVVLPIVVFTGSGRLPCPPSGETFQTNPIAYASWMTVLWTLGVVGVVVVPALSTSLTAWVCVKNEYDRQQQQDMRREQEEHEVAQMRDSEDTTPSFVDLEAAEVAAPLPSQSTTM